MSELSPSGTIRYGSVWEDADVLCRAMAPVAPGGRLLSIASAGDNALALLTLDPAEVVAVDYNPAQIACLELRVAVFRVLEYEEALSFLGVTPCRDRLKTYEQLRPALPQGARRFWDMHPHGVRSGIIHAGRLERYLRLFRRGILPLVHRRSTIDALGECRSREERDRFYRQVWDTPRWRWLFRFFFSQWVMARLGRDPSYFAHVGGSFSERLLLRTHMALVAQPTHNNPFLAYVLKGTYPLDALPMYLLPEHYPIIRARLDRLQPVCESLGRYLLGAVGWFDGFNLSDLFEYLSPELHEALYVALLERARSGGRLVYWNLQVPRGIPSPCTVRARSLEEVSRELRERDRIWFYEALHVDEVSGGAGTLIPKLEVASKTP